MRRRITRTQSLLVGATAALFAGAYVLQDPQTAPTVSSTVAEVARPTSSATYLARAVAVKATATETQLALDAFASRVTGLSHETALGDAFRSYFAYKAANPEQVKKPYLYFVDYGLPSTKPRGYVFDMEKLTIVDGPFMVAHGRGSAASGEAVPTRFSNRHGSAATSLGLYLAQETYNFSGKASGRYYKSIGLRMKGLSKGFNDNARTRGVVAHGAPYVSATRAGRSEGCPAVEEFRARRLMPMLANGGMVFLFAPNSDWMARDPWLLAGAQRDGRMAS